MQFPKLSFKSLWTKPATESVSIPSHLNPASYRSAPAPRVRKKQLVLFVRFPIKEQVHFAKRLSFLIGAGVSVLDSLYLLRDQAKGSSRKYIYSEIIEDITSGQYLSKSLEKFERFFGSFAINIIKIGESGGVLTQNLTYLAEELRKKQELRKKVIGALIYPVFITIATLVLSGLLTVFIFPKVMPIFQSLNVQLPLTTIILLAISNFLAAYGFHLIGGIIVFIIGFRVALKVLPTFRFLMHRIVLHVPLFGRLIKYYYMTNFCRTLGLLLKSGINIVDAVSITGDTLGNDVYQHECKKLSAVVTRGERLSTYIQTRPALFPDFTAHLIAVGETTGSLSDTLVYLSDMYESEVSDMTKNLSNSIEPILMIFMGLIVGFVAVSVITPIYEVTQHLQP